MDKRDFQFRPDYWDCIWKDNHVDVNKKLAPAFRLGFGEKNFKVLGRLRPLKYCGFLNLLEINTLKGTKNFRPSYFPSVNAGANI